MVIELEGQKFELTTPDEKLWNRIKQNPLYAKGGDPLGHENKASWGRPSKKKYASILGGENEFSQNEVAQLCIRDDIGYRPVLIPVDENGQPDRSVFRLNGEVVKMYTLLMGDKPVNGAESPEYESGDDLVKLSLTEDDYGDEFLLPWIIIDGVAVAKVNFLTSISYDELGKLKMI